MKPGAWVGLIILFAALGFGAKAFVSNLSPAVSFADARIARGTVQVVGKLDKKSIAVETGGLLKFAILDDKGDRMAVEFAGQKANNFEQATQVTAIGKYDGQIFHADNLLVKCPTKYQGTDTKEYGAGQTSGGAPATGRSFLPTDKRDLR